MKSRKTDTPKLRLAGVSKKDMPSYIEVNGVCYERISMPTVRIELDLDPESQKLIRKAVKSGKYVNEQEAVRDAVRGLIDNA